MLKELHWFRNDGGPLLIIPEPAAPSWEGGDPPSGGRVVEATFRYDSPIATDYDRACDIKDCAGVVQIGPSWGVVLGDTTSASVAWLATADPARFYTVGVDAIDDNSPSALLSLAHGAGTDWRRLLASADVTNRGLLLMHAASRAAEVEEHRSDASGTALIGDGIRHLAPAARYAVDTLTAQTGNRTFVTFVRFTRADH